MSALSKLKYHQSEIDKLWMEYETIFKPLDLPPDIRKKIDKEYRDKKEYHRTRMAEIAKAAWNDDPASRESWICKLYKWWRSWRFPS